MSNQSQRGNKVPSYDRLRAIACDPDATVHFVGVGGISMYSLARLTMLLGAGVSGSDRAENERTSELLLLGAKIKIGHSPDNIGAVDLVVRTHAVGEDNPELRAAVSRGIIIVSRAEYMAALMLDYSYRIGVSGSHGKSTTVAMLDCIFTRAMRRPTVLSGANLSHGEPFRIGDKGLMIYEGCEYKDSFLKFMPDIAVGLNLELDHTDYFADIDALTDSFIRALGRAKQFALISGDDPNLQKVKQNLPCRVVSFGSGDNNDYRYFITSFNEVGFDFSISRFGSCVEEFKLNIPGVFNLHNATAAIAVALECGIDTEIIKEAISSYRGIEGRLEYIGDRHGRQVYYDYAHHPTEIRATVNALKMLTGRPVTAVFKPHTFSRTKSLWSDFVGALSVSDYTIITDIFPAREEPIEGISSQRLASDIGGRALYCPDNDVADALDRYTSGVILLMGAGDFKEIRKRTLKK